MTQPVPGLELLRLASEIAVKNPSPATAAVQVQPVKKKRGRKPTPGMTEEERKRARLLKNRRTAEMSRRRKNLYIQTLTSQRDTALAECERLRADNRRLRAIIQNTSCPRSNYNILHTDTGSDISSR